MLTILYIIFIIFLIIDATGILSLATMTSVAKNIYKDATNQIKDESGLNNFVTFQTNGTMVCIFDLGNILIKKKTINVAFIFRIIFLSSFLFFKLEAGTYIWIFCASLTFWISEEILSRITKNSIEK